jgi:hypothetical protein
MRFKTQRIEAMDSRIERTSRFLVAAVAIFLCSSSLMGDGAKSADIRVDLTSQNPPSLHVTIHSRAKVPVSFFKWRLPWGNRNTMILVAVKADKNYLTRNFPIDDPAPERVSIGPNESLSGEVSLEKAFTGLDDALKKSDINLFWAYQPPEELNIGRWSGGWILIPQH